MRTVSYRLADVAKVTIALGHVAENDATRVQIDAGQIFAEYPDAVPSLTLTNPDSVSYPAVVVKDGNNVIWDVKDSDLAVPGTGEFQLTFTDNGTVVKSCIGKTKICRSIVGEGPAPDPVQDWIDRAEDVLEEIETAFPEGGTTGQVLAKKSDADFDTEWVDQGAGGVSDYDDLENRPQIGGVTLTGDKSLHDLGAAAESDIPDVSGFYTKPAGGIPASDIADGVIPDPEDLIDDTAGAGDTEKVWSADKSSSLLRAIDKLTPDATASDIGKALIVKTVADGKPSSYEYGEAGGGSVDPSAIAQAVDDWCDENITNPDSPPLDRSLTASSAAAPADMVGELAGKIGDDWNSSTQTITPSSSATAGYAYFSPVSTGSSISISTNASHSYYTYNNLIPGKTYHFKTYSNTSWNNNHIVFANSSNKVTGYAIGQQSTAGSVEANVTVPADTVLTYVICNKGTSDTSSSIAVTINDITPLTTDVKNIREDVEDITTATVGDVDKALCPKTVSDGKVTEWQFKELGSGANTESRYESVSPVLNSTATGRTSATVGSTISFGSQTDWYHVKFSAEPGSYRGTYFSSNSTKYSNIVAVDSSEKVLEILNDTPSGAGVITKTFTAPANTAAIYLCCYGDIGRASTALMLEKVVDATDSERLDNVEKQITSATANITKPAVSAFMANVTYTDGDYSDSAVNGYINNPKKIYREDIPNPVVVRWNPIDEAVSITVTITTANSPYYGRDISYETEPTASSLAIYNLIPNTTYYYQVTAILTNGTSTILSKGTVTTENSIVRMLNIDGIVNVRDIGGKTATGGTVNYGLIYRGSELDGVGFPSSEALGAGTGASILTDNGRLEMLNHVGIRAELDLRAGTYTKSVIAPILDFECVGFPFYENVLVGDGLVALKTAFDFIVSEVSQGRPVYLHCSGGNDRTGTLVTCLLGLLGVSENDLSKEYELSSFTFGQSRARNSTSYNYKGLMTGVLALTGDTLADKFETLFTNASVTSASIASFKSAMITT